MVHAWSHSFVDVFKAFVNIFIELDEKVAEVSIVQHGGAVDLWVPQEDEEKHLEHVVEGNDSEDESSEVVHDLEEAEHDPVREPLLLELGVIGIEREEGSADWVHNSK